MCGVIGLIYQRHRQDLGRIAADLLKTLEYRGYDSTGAAIQGEGTEVRLVKGVGAPSVMVHQLGIVDMAGQVLCGQVRWATFGAVNDVNSQPHKVGCKVDIYGAHNGNVTNCDALKVWLTSEGHDVKSDNDGEMVVHTVEHYFAQQLYTRDGGERTDPEVRRGCMRAALISTARRLEGSYAAVVVDPVSRRLWAIKQGSSLYFGLGQDREGGSFAIASSDLSSVLKLTRVVVPLSEGEVMEFDAEHRQILCIVDRTVQGPAGEERFTAGQEVERQPRRSRLRAKDTTLRPPFETFMDQEISAQEQTCRNVVGIFSGGSETLRAMSPFLESVPADALEVLSAHLETIRDQYDDEQIRRRFHALSDLPAIRGLLDALPGSIVAQCEGVPAEKVADDLASSEAGFFADLLPMARDAMDLRAVRLMDALLEHTEVREFAQRVEGFGRLCLESLEQFGRLYVVCCGSSYHAAKAGALFFTQLARAELIPVLPGEFRAQVAGSMRDGDLFIAVSQSGETKDLIDVMNDVIASGQRIKRVAVVNNVNSTLAQEKSHLVIPLRCGPEIAVPATKSFINQMAVLYCLALHLGERRLQDSRFSPPDRQDMARDLARRRHKLSSMPVLIRETVASTETEIERAAQLLHLAPSIHILATRLSAVAKEGALKVREVVLNHTEGFEGSEFKHGPNTILGFNTVLGPREVDAMMVRVGHIQEELARRAEERGLGTASMRRLVQAVTDSVFSLASTTFSLDPGEMELFQEVFSRDEALSPLYTDYPLIYITGPDERDVALTVSQINTHKIRGASTVVIAEEHPALQGAAAKVPAGNSRYQSVFITLPRTNDTLLATFSATVVLQRLALRMSLLKAQYLDRLGIVDHGVHPDVPKNVSKSITVD